MIPGAFPIVAGAGFKAKAVTFDGASYLKRSSAFSGITNTAEGTYSFWVHLISGDGTIRPIIDWARAPSPNRALTCTVNADNAITSVGTGTGGTNLFFVTSAADTITADGNWHHIIASWKFHVFKLYVDDVLALNLTTVPTSGNYDYANMNLPQICGNSESNSPSFTECDLAEMFFDTRFVDLSIAANRAKFRNPATGKPVSLGADGSAATGVQPIVYLSGPASSFNVNKGSGGDFTVSGTLTDASTSPSD